jgi:hypothetical protein
MRADCLLLVFFCLGASVDADVLVRWDQDEIPPAVSLGITTIVVPAAKTRAIEHAVSQGYDVYVEQPTEKRVMPIDKASAKGRSVAIDHRGKWPHIRSNVVTRRNAILQVTGRSVQPWIENNAALVRIIRATSPGATPFLTYAWKPITLSDADEGPAPENYLVAIAEAGSFGGDLLLPLHESFERDLLLGKPQARAAWSEIRRYIEFYSWNLPARYRPIANVAVVTAEPMKRFEVMNLLARHNVPFALVAPSSLAADQLDRFRLLIVLEQLSARAADVVAEFERRGGAVVTANAVSDPDKFALDIRQKLGREHRVIDIWNGLTVITAPYEAPDGKTVLVTAVNYSHQPLPVQMRVRGTFSLVQYESPEQPAALLPYEHRDGYTEFVVPGLRIGGRVFLTPSGGSK